MTADPMAQPAPTGPPAASDLADWQTRVRGRNIHEATLLATDYLNHLNELVMLLEMVPDMPEMLEDCREWQPKSYVEHFQDSGFSDKELAIEAYDHVPARFRQAFEDTVGKFDRATAAVLTHLDEVMADEVLLRFRCQNAVQTLQELIGVCNAIIHGEERTISQSEIDELLGHPTASAPAGGRA